MSETRMTKIANRWALFSGIIIAGFWLGYFILKNSTPPLGPIEIGEFELASSVPRWWGDILLGSLWVWMFVRTILRSTFENILFFITSVCIFSIIIMLSAAPRIELVYFCIIWYIASILVYKFFSAKAWFLGVALVLGIKLGFLSGGLITGMILLLFLGTTWILEYLYYLLFQKTGLTRWLAGY